MRLCVSGRVADVLVQRERQPCSGAASIIKGVNNPDFLNAGCRVAGDRDFEGNHVTGLMDGSDVRNIRRGRQGRGVVYQS